MTGLPEQHVYGLVQPNAVLVDLGQASKDLGCGSIVMGADKGKQYKENISRNHAHVLW